MYARRALYQLSYIASPAGLLSTCSDNSISACLPQWSLLLHLPLLRADWKSGDGFFLFSLLQPLPWSSQQPLILPMDGNIPPTCSLGIYQGIFQHSLALSSVSYRHEFFIIEGTNLICISER